MRWKHSHETFGLDNRENIVIHMADSAMWVAGAGLKSGYVHGETDEFSHYAVKDLVTHHDWLTTVLDRFGLDAKSLNFEVGTQKLSLVENANARIIKENLA